jgi:hypothetical protein
VDCKGLTVEAPEGLGLLALGLLGNEPVVALVVHSVARNQSKASQDANVESSRDVERGLVWEPVDADKEESRGVRQRDLVINHTTGHVALGENVNKITALYRRRAVGWQRKLKNRPVRDVLQWLQVHNKPPSMSELLVDKVRQENALMSEMYVLVEPPSLGRVAVRTATEEAAADEVRVVQSARVEVGVTYGERTCEA